MALYGRGAHLVDYAMNKILNRSSDPENCGSCQVGKSHPPETLLGINIQIAYM